MKFSQTVYCKPVAAILIFLWSTAYSFGISRISIASGDWNASATWSPSGSPSPTDNITIAPGHTVTVSTNQTIHHVVVNAGGTLTWSTINTLSITGNLTVDGTVSMNSGNISLTSYGLQFILGSNALFTWDPGTNTAAAATLFTNGIESFSPTSTLVIKKWYNYTVPITSVVTGNFGNLELNSYNGNTITEWNQNNGFQTHQVLGTLSVDIGWITLDKSGSISNTTIGKVLLKNTNSTLYGHYGTHPSTFTLTTGSVTNNGGTFYGINDGNGNIILHVTGNFINYGNVKVINNSGIAGLSNGNAILTVDSAYIQTGGDTRIIYNVSTTNSGLFSANFRNVILSGGIFMGQSGCRTAGGLCNINITQNLSISFQNSTDKFRGASISSIGASINMVQVTLLIGGNLTIAGVLNAEVTSSAAGGTEYVTVNGTTTISGCNVSFNYGAATAAHANTLTFNSHVAVNGGIIFLSRNNGPSTINLNGNLAISAGQMTVKGGDSTTTMVVSGTYAQSGGQFYIHNNSTIPSTTSTRVSILDNFTQVSGLLSFDSNPSNTSANHTLEIKGSSFTLGGNGSITRAGVGNCTSFGVLNFRRNGMVNYNRTSTSSTISQVKQLISNPCIVKVLYGNFVAASYPSLINDMVKVGSGGTLDVTGSQVIANGAFPFSCITIDSNATIITQRTQGFYDGSTSSCIHGSMSFILDPYSTVEYNGSANQTVTGNIAGIPPVQNQYGILKIKMQNGTSKAMMNNPVIVRSKLILTNGELNLGGNVLTLNSGFASSLTRTNGYINSELTGLTPGTIIWKNVYKGLHEFPFGVSPTVYLPVRLFFMAGNVTDVVASTYATPTHDNLPFPLVNGSQVNFSSVEASYPNTNLIDRWWYINAPGVVAGLTLAYQGTENTMDPGFQSGPIGVLSWTGNGWSAPASSGIGITAGIGTVSAEIMSDFSAIVVGRQMGLKAISNIRSFTAKQIGDEIALNWSTIVEYNSDYFSVERSNDGINFEEIVRQNASVNSTGVLRYSAIDNHPETGKNYYRIKLTSRNGASSFSMIQEVEVSKTSFADLSVVSFGPNPFETGFNVEYKMGKDAAVRFELSAANGQFIYQSEADETKGTHTFHFSEGSNLQPGIYFLKIISSGKSITQKLLKK